MSNQDKAMSGEEKQLLKSVVGTHLREDLIFDHFDFIRMESLGDLKDQHNEAYDEYREAYDELEGIKDRIEELEVELEKARNTFERRGGEDEMEALGGTISELETLGVHIRRYEREKANISTLKLT